MTLNDKIQTLTNFAKQLEKQTNNTIPIKHEKGYIQLILPKGTIELHREVNQLQCSIKTRNNHYQDVLEFNSLISLQNKLLQATKLINTWHDEFSKNEKLGIIKH